MNNTSKLMVLGGVLVAAVALILVVENLPAGRAGSDRKAQPFFPDFDEGKCSAFQIAEKDTVKVFRKGDVWMVSTGGGSAAVTNEQQAIPPMAGDATDQTPSSGETKSYAADSVSVHAALEKLANMKRDILISQNPDKQETFEVDSTKGLLVEVWDRNGTSRGAFRIGKSGPDWSSNYVRSIGSDDVWAVGGSIKHAFFSDLNRWRDKTIMAFDATTATQISIARKDTSTGEISTVKLQKTADTAGTMQWTITEPEQAAAKADVVSRLLETLSKLKTSDWAEGPVADEVSGFDSPILSATVVFENGDTQKVLVGKKQESGGKIYVRAEDKDDIFLVYDSACRNIDKGFGDLKAD